MSSFQEGGGNLQVCQILYLSSRCLMGMGSRNKFAGRLDDMYSSCTAGPRWECTLAMFAARGRFGTQLG